MFIPSSAGKLAIMDPLSIAASVAGIIAAAASIAKAIAPYASAVKKLPTIALKVRSEMVNTQILLGALQTLMNNLDTSDPSRTNLIDIDHLVVVFTDGVLIFSELEAAVLAIEPAGERLGSMSRMTWVRSEGPIKDIVERLGMFKDSILIFLNILQWRVILVRLAHVTSVLTPSSNSDIQASKNQRTLHGKVDTLLTNDADLARRVMDVEDVFDSLSMAKNNSEDVPLQHATSLREESPSQTPAAVEAEERLMNGTQPVDPVSVKGHQFPAPAGLPHIRVDDDQPSSFSDRQEGIPVFAFEPALEDSRAYKRSRVDRSLLPSHASTAQTNTWSVFSGMSLSDISVVAAIALPLYSKDISNSQHYNFTRPENAPALHVRTVKPARSRLSRFSPFAEDDADFRANDENAIGQWAQSRRRNFRLRGMHSEMLCDVPVIFVTRPDYPGQGPVRDKPVIFLDGTEGSRQRSWTEMPKSMYDINLNGDDLAALERKLERKDKEEAKKNRRGLTQSKATWLTLLETIQRMESESFEFASRHTSANLKPSEFEGYYQSSRTLTVVIQKKTVNWNSMPTEIRRGYGITTWCHFVEVLAMLGIYWTVLDVPHNTHHAQGNGFVVTSHFVPGLGNLFSFLRSKASRFEERRVVPTEHVRELAFGLVSTTLNTTPRSV